MNKQENDILNALYREPFINQRVLAEMSGHSLGVVNRSIRSLMQNGYLDESVGLTEKARSLFKARKPRNAIILAAGFGMRMVPINMTTPKALLEVNGERLIDRLIRQLHEVGIQDITVVVGFMKDAFEYLIDEFGVKLVYNEDYAGRNNLSSLRLVVDDVSNTYIVPCDIWCDRNPFRRSELYSWYMVSDLVDESSDVRVNRKMELVSVRENVGGNGMIGIAYLTEEPAETVRRRVCELAADSRYNGSFWESTLYSEGRMIVQARIVHASDVVEINTYEQLRELDSDSNHLQSDALSMIAETLGCAERDIVRIEVLKKGMTNRSFIFTVRDRRYIMRIPGEGTDRLIDRRQEADVYAMVSGLGLCDDPIYFSRENGYKITRYIENVRCCDPENVEELRLCMRKLKRFHDRKLSVPYVFDIFGQIEFYEQLWGGRPSIYVDYEKTKHHVLELRPFIDAHAAPMCLTHIDAVPDNFLFDPSDEGELSVQLIDWEYAGMQDPHVDIAMFIIYSMYDRAEADRLIDLYFEGEGGCDEVTRTKIYCYIAVCGLLWSNWCEYKRGLGVEFGAYSLRQYRYAKEYYRLARERMEHNGSGA